MAGMVKMYNKALGATFMAPKNAVEIYKEKGWKVGDFPKPKAAKKEDASE